jgi:hypothetical protein
VGTVLTLGMLPQVHRQNITVYENMWVYIAMDKVDFNL